MVAKNMEEIENIGKGDDAMEQSVAYVKEFLKENGTTFQDRLIYEKNVGRDEGKKENAIETAKNLLNTSLTIEEIAAATGLSYKEIEALE